MDLAKVNWPWQMQGPTASLLPYSRGWPGVHERETDLGPLCTGSPSSVPQAAPDDDFRLIFLPVLVGRFGEAPPPCSAWPPNSGLSPHLVWQELWGLLGDPE